MKNILILIGLLVFSFSSKSQHYQSAKLKKEGIQLLDSAAKPAKLIPLKQVKWFAFNKVSQTLVYVRLQKKSKQKPEEGNSPEDRLVICSYSFEKDSEQVLLTTCLDGKAGTHAPYGKSDIFPHEGFCEPEAFHLSKDGKRLVFQTAGWKVAPAVHCLNVKTGSLVFMGAGWIKQVRKHGLEMEITGLDPSGEKGRFTQLVLVNWNGKRLKELGERVY